MTVSLVLSGFSEGVFLSSTYLPAAAYFTHPCTSYLEMMSIKNTFSLYWKLVLLSNLAGCALIEKRHFYQEPSVPKGVPNSTPDGQNQGSRCRRPGQQRKCHTYGCRYYYTASFSRCSELPEYRPVPGVRIGVSINIILYHPSIASLIRSSLCPSTTGHPMHRTHPALLQCKIFREPPYPSG